MIHVIGSTGFVGSAVCAHFKNRAIEYAGVNRRNYQEYIGSKTDYLINANGSGLKGRANENPKDDFEKNVKSTINLIYDFEFKTFIHISSVDVYSETSYSEKTYEDSPIDISKLRPYGFHKYLSELIVKQYCPNWIILRLGGLVGKNLKKNAIYDWTHNKPFLMSTNSKLTFIHTAAVAEIINCLIDKKVTRQIINVCSSDSIRLQELASVADFKIEEIETHGELKVQNYHINIGKLKKYFQVKTSREYIEKYLKESL